MEKAVATLRGGLQRGRSWCQAKFRRVTRNRGRVSIWNDSRSRPAAVVLMAVLLGGLGLHALRAPVQEVVVEAKGIRVTYRVAVPHDRLAMFHKQLERYKTPSTGDHDAEYYAAQWQKQAAEYYFQHAERRYATAQRLAQAEAARPKSVIRQAAYADSLPAMPDRSEVQMYQDRLEQATARFAAVAALAEEGRQQQPRVLGARPVLAFPTATEFLTLFSLAGLAAYAYWFLARPRPAKLLLRADRQVVVAPEWVTESPDGYVCWTRRVDVIAWTTCVLGALVWVSRQLI